MAQGHSVVGSLSLPCLSSGRRLECLGCTLCGCLCLGLAPCRTLLRVQQARRLSPSGVLTSRSRTPSPTSCFRSHSGIAPYSGEVACSATSFRDARGLPCTPGTCQGCCTPRTPPASSVHSSEFLEPLACFSVSCLSSWSAPGGSATGVSAPASRARCRG
jgi:hypothetical protein